MIHHWVTLGLIAGSLYYGLTEIGCLVMICHDNADMFLALTKVCGFENFEIGKNIFFCCFAISWVVCRIILFSSKVIIPLLLDAAPMYTCHFAYPCFVIALVILLLLHFYWLSMICTVAFNKFKGGTIQDTRSDSEKHD